jgi:membrane protein implicated in regulation of membrane protease activity
MKMFLLLAVGTVIAAGMLPSLPAKIILVAFVLLAALIEGGRRVSKNRKTKPKFLFEQ